jgi:ribosomal protein L35
MAWAHLVAVSIETGQPGNSHGLETKIKEQSRGTQKAERLHQRKSVEDEKLL